jgi:hypothetical protein
MASESPCNRVKCYTIISQLCVSHMGAWRCFHPGALICVSPCYLFLVTYRSFDSEYQAYKDGVEVQAGLVRKITYAFDGHKASFQCRATDAIVVEDAIRTLYDVSNLRGGMGQTWQMGRCVRAIHQARRAPHSA